MTDNKTVEKLLKAGSVFTPGAPINTTDLFSGRVRQLQAVYNAIAQAGRHVILFGERGVGKTSLAKIVSEQLHENSYIKMKSKTINCDITDDFSSIWRKVFREIPVPQRAEQMGFGTDTYEEMIPLTLHLPDPTSPIVPDDVRYLLQELPKPAFIVIDEIDRIKDKSTTTQLADTIKNLSDHSITTTLVLVGVADSVGELITEHASIQRALAQVRMRRMSTPELHEILDKGLKELGMTIEIGAKYKIAQLSQGLPEYTHSLGLFASQNAISEGRSHINFEDVKTAISLTVENTQQSIRDAYHSATRSPRRENLYEKVLIACALAPADFLSYFTPASVRRPMSAIMGKEYDIPAFIRHLKEFASEKRGPVLHMTGTRRSYRLRFIAPLMQPYAIAHGLTIGLLSHELLDELTKEKQRAEPKTATNEL